MGRAVARRADLAIITNDNPRGEDPAAIARQILAGTDQADSKADVAVELDRTLAIQRALALAESGDCVLIAGKGHETYQEIGSRAAAARRSPDRPRLALQRRPARVPASCPLPA